MKLNIIIISFLVCLLISCEKIAVLSTPRKKADISHSQQAIQAKNQFWETLHEGRYQDISSIDFLLTDAYLHYPNDPEIAAYLGFLHLWKLAERTRHKTISPLITNEIILSKEYFSDAIELDPNDARTFGF